ncbi:NYN domain-containing protein [Gryllotalpicola protaetiae]|uniref:NYN domain-containing protein n=1 Tax=Gryllotalpicola protaetiae TaxID=2419771 RepID=A0A387BPZ2_9MICO|nr:NYN domain-containing protein [Gryllotalpicola protaetiae]AYG03090.1 NYN domain-containing protein [Gryllotalpicola protaetiae]
MPETPHLAVLIDADNVAPRRLAALLAEVSKYGDASVRRMYGDWTSDQLKSWKGAVNEYAIRPVQQFAYTTGKNATDSALIIDAMDLLYTRRFDGFCLVSSDSDFTGLASRLRESGATVYGFGERKTPQAFVNACNRFTYFDVIELDVDEAEAAATAAATEVAAEAIAGATKPKAKQSAKAVASVPARKQPTQNELRGDTRLIQLLRAGIRDASDDDGWADLAAVGQLIRQQAPEFDPRNWGFAKLVGLINAIGLFTVTRVDSPNGGSLVRVKDERP